jgi:hypothetical protein
MTCCQNRLGASVLFELIIRILITIYGTSAVVPGIFPVIGEKWHRMIEALLEE